MRRGKVSVIVLTLFLIVLVIYGLWALKRPYNLVKPSINPLSSLATTSKLVWPGVGQSAVGLLGTNVLDTHNPQTPAPTASTAKMVTALLILQAKPLRIGQTGPVITLSQNDVNIYNNYVNEKGSVVPVVNGEQISELQMLEAMLLPSANNMADSLAIWAYGSLDNYSKAANTYIADLGLTSTHIGSDASGFNPSTVSTAADLVRIGEKFMDNQVLESIVNQIIIKGIPETSGVKNVNYLLDTNGVIGIKTGNTDQAGGVYVSASLAKVDQKRVTIITANMSAPTLAQAVSGSLPLINSAQSNFVKVKLLDSGTELGQYTLPWDKSSVGAAINGSLSATVWGGSQVSLGQISLAPLAYPESAGRVVGTVSASGSGVISSDQVNVSTEKSFTRPSVFWRLTHP